jgi:hypothetical protein
MLETDYPILLVIVGFKRLASGATAPVAMPIHMMTHPAAHKTSGFKNAAARSLAPRLQSVRVFLLV